MGSFESSGGQRFPYTYDQVFAGLLKVLPQNGFKVKSQDKDIGRIECSAGASLFSWGENISISVEDLDSYSTRLDIHSGLKVQGTRQALFTGEGRNTRNVTVIISALSNYLKTQKKPVRPAVSGAAAPPPPPSATTSFFIYIKDEVKGPFSPAQINALLQVDSVTPTTPCIPEGSQEWRTVADFVS
jgi:hypothetical protein